VLEPGASSAESSALFGGFLVRRFFVMPVTAGASSAQELGVFRCPWGPACMVVGGAVKMAISRLAVWRAGWCRRPYPRYPALPLIGVRNRIRVMVLLRPIEPQNKPHFWASDASFVGSQVTATPHQHQLAVFVHSPAWPAMLHPSAAP